MGSDPNEAPSEGYTVVVDDNSHYQDPDYRRVITGFATADEALQKCRSIVDACLAECAEPGDTADQILRGYQFYGDDPWIRGSDVRFSAWDYAEENAHRFVK
ncbi:hypothetical protein [Parafrankia sp. BMG5.11]|uniref:hypothetical protein n=1 Tax=Parafrankia sp. BMG5.11 TaxID=222540 RepID=UPI00103D2E0C|nr:hypothetical protein [Parafrankia sp. BMG5.11]TCJ41283.1 hypothetical protein E0504_01335 [Parafrankia sp. BMG5.11]